MNFLIELVIGNLPAILGGIGALFGLGWVYNKGRKHARNKADKELKNAKDDFIGELQDARDAGDRALDRELRNNGG